MNDDLVMVGPRAPHASAAAPAVVPAVVPAVAPATEPKPKPSAQSVAAAIVRAISNGQVDDQIQEIAASIKLRYDVVAALKRSTINVLDRVRVTGECRPRKYIGLTGTVTAKEGKWIRVQPDETFKYVVNFGRSIRFGASILEVLPK